jgi:cysteine-rich repeat protein
MLPRPEQTLRHGGAAALALALFLASPSGAQADTLTTAKCRDAVTLATRRAATLTVNARTTCVRLRMNRRIPASVNCMADPSALGGPGTGDEKTDSALAKLVQHAARHQKRIVAACSGLDLESVGVADVCSPATSQPPLLAQCATFELGKPAGDAMSALLNVPAGSSRPGGDARRCYSVIDRGVRFNLRQLQDLAGDCFNLAEETAASSTRCLTTFAPPGIVNSTGFPDIDAKLTNRLTRFRATMLDFCRDVNPTKLGFGTILSDPTVAPLTFEDVFSEVYDGLLSAATGLNDAVYPTVAFCGNGVVEAGEECDDGDRESCDGCDRDCSIPRCGNGVACGNESCDDGNVASGDGCDAVCIAEVCGNGVVQAGEDCDDGTANSNVLANACRTDCDLPSCGDGVVDAGETCDPPGLDGCEPGCRSANCGDGTLDPGEDCDDGAANSDTTPDACRTSCSLPSCGDGVVDAGEQCDPPDGGVTCKSDCHYATCGNGFIDPGEGCDDGAANSDVAPNACRTNCQPAHCGDGVTDAGETCDGGGATLTCDPDCTAVQCGDGVRNTAAGETCDDGNLASGDGCDENCTVTACGNGIVTPPELCDDGDTSGGDGCSATCTCGPGSGEVGPCGTQDLRCPDRSEVVLRAGTTGTACTKNGDCSSGTCDTVLGRCVTLSELDTGWTGIAHDSDIVDAALTSVIMLCPGPAPTCGECGIVGIDPSPGNCRCANDNRKICDQPFVADANDCGGNVCNCYFGVPLPLSSGNTPACVVNRFREDLRGTVDVDSGAGTSSVRLASVVYLGISVVEPCPSCGGKCSAPAANFGLPCAVDLDCDADTGDGTGVCGSYDPVPNDGLRQGTCRGGANDGQSCDAGARHESFPAPGGAMHSLDCFPDAGKNVSGTGLRIDIDQATTTSILSVGVTCGYPPYIVDECHCGQCSGASSIPCNSDAVCAALGAGTCVRAGNNDPLPNQCALDGICNDAGGGEGVCNQGPTDKFCDGLVRANGEGFIACQNQSDCDAFPNGIAGSCTLAKGRECFLDTIVAKGSADPRYPVAAAAFCIGRTGNGGINSVAGLPGPGRIVNQAEVTHFCASNPAVAYVPGVGGCP